MKSRQLVLKRSKYCTAVFSLMFISGVMQGQGNCCPVELALRAAERLQKGMDRTELEKAFELDGGITFRDQTVYVYRSCPYLKIRVSFQHTPDMHQEHTRQDKIESVSAMFVERPNAD